MSPSDSICSVEAAWIQTRPYLSVTHILSASLFTRVAWKVETINVAQKVSQDVYSTHRAYVLGGIVFSVTFLEATINELSTDAAEGELSQLKGLKQEGTAPGKREDWSRISKLRSSKYKQPVILDKYEQALRLVGEEPFDRALPIYQNVLLLIALRNALIHAKPEWIPGAGIPDLLDPNVGGPTLRHRLAERITLNPLFPSVNPLYPDRCLSHNCAEWAVKSSISFVDEFCKRLGISPAFDYVRQDLNTR